jgi:IS5 family transposase
MNPSKIDNSQDNLFRSRLSNQLNPKHEMMILSKMINWDDLEVEFSSFHADSGKGGQPPKPVRLMVGLLLLQHLHSLSDEQVVRGFIENPYWQFFCGYDFLQWEFPIDPSSLTRFRNRIGSDAMNRILSLTIKVAVKSEAVAVKDLEKIIVDSTVMPKNIAFPTDSKLYAKARQNLVKLAGKHGITLRQNYNLVAKRLSFQIGRYLHAKQMKRARKAMKKLKVILGRVVRDVERKIALAADHQKIQLEKIFAPQITQTKRLLAQKRADKKKLYSLHEPNVDCISKGKARVRYEFGCKVSLTTTHKQGLVMASQAIAGNPYDGHTLKSAIEESQDNCSKFTNIKIKSAFVDKGYKGHGIDPKESGINIFISGQKRHNGKKLTQSIKKQLKRRSAIEPMIGHMKNDGRLGLGRLKGIIGDQINAILAAAGHNLRLILNHIRKMIKENSENMLKLLQNFLNKILLRGFCITKNILRESLLVRV